MANRGVAGSQDTPVLSLLWEVCRGYSRGGGSQNTCVSKVEGDRGWDDCAGGELKGKRATKKLFLSLLFTTGEQS